jgi:peptide/nickel transport system substrate-binding protein
MWPGSIDAAKWPPAVALLLWAGLTAGCQPPARGAADAPVLRIGVGIGDSARTAGISGLTDLLYSESLLQREWDGSVGRRLATGWSWGNEGTILTVRLKEGVLLHDGSTLTAESVARQLARLVPGRGRAAAWGFQYVSDVSAPDSRTIILKLSQPDMFLLTALSDLKITGPESPDISTGAFKLIHRTPTVETRRFDRYHGGAPFLSGVRILTYETQRSAWAALMRGEVDVVQEVSRDSVEFLEGSSDVRTYSSIQPFYIPLVFNHRHPALRNREVRRAISEAINRQKILQRAMRGRGEVAHSPIWPLHWAYSAAGGQYRFDPQSAMARLDRAGFRMPPLGPSGQLRTRFSLNCLVYGEDPQYERIALMVQRQLFDIGIDLVIELAPLDQLAKRVSTGDFETFLMRANAGRTLEWTYRFWRSGTDVHAPTQSSGYVGADALFDQLRRSTSDEEVRTAVSLLAEQFYEDAPAAFIAWLDVTRAVDSRFVVPDAGKEDPFANIWQWRPAAREHQ